jgi:hypothetical protein
VLKACPNYLARPTPVLPGLPYWLQNGMHSCLTLRFKNRNYEKEQCQNY